MIHTAKCKFIVPLIILAIMTVLFTGCSKEEPADPIAPVDTGLLVVTPIEEVHDEEPTPIPSDFAMNPLTGLFDMSFDNVGKKSMAIIINNHRAAIPQRGVSQADMYYEYETEGGQTRLVVLFADVNDIPEIGSLRSARIVSVDIAGATQSILVHFGANRRVPDHLETHGVERIDGNVYCASSGQSVNGQIELSGNRFFWRDDVWRAERATEHTAVTNGQQLLRAAEHTQVSLDGETRVMYNFSEESSILTNAETCNRLNVYFSATNGDSLFEYDSTTNLYTKSQYGNLQIDETNGQPIQVHNVFVLFAEIEQHTDSTVNIFLERGGSGYYATNGLIVPILWTKDSPTDPFQFTDIEGNELEVIPGISYINIVRSTQSDKLTFS